MKVTNKILMAALTALLITIGLWNSAVFAGEKWLTSLDDAKKAAAKEGKDILVDFSGSDWCGWCIKLDKEVFSTKEWAATGAKKFVMLLADFPRKNDMSQEQKDRNDKLKEEFMVSGFPSVFLLDAAGAPYAKTGYQDGGPEKYMEHLKKLMRQKDERNEAAEQIKEAPVKDKPALLDQLIEKLDKWEIGFWYAGMKEDAVKFDEDNKQGFRLKYAAELAYYYHALKDKPRLEYYFGIVKKLSPEKTAEIELDFKLDDIQAGYYRQQKWKDALVELNALAQAGYKGEAAQKIYYQIALAHNGLKENKQVRESLEKALDLAPDSKLGREIKQILEKLKSK